jgi:hypothetical protein
MAKAKNSSGIKENWLMEESIRALRAEAEKKNGKSKMNEIGKQYVRVPHPTLRNTYILKEKK